MILYQWYDINSTFCAFLSSSCKQVKKVLFVSFSHEKRIAVLRKLQHSCQPTRCPPVSEPKGIRQSDSMLSCNLATSARCEVRWPCRATTSKGSSSFPVAAPASSAACRTKEQPSVAPRPTLRRRGRRVVAAASNSQQNGSRNLLVVGPGVLGSLVCQRWLNVREHTSRDANANTSRFLFFGLFVFPLRPLSKRKNKQRKDVSYMCSLFFLHPISLIPSTPPYRNFLLLL